MVTHPSGDEFVIDRLGRDGEGRAGTRAIPGALPGERVRVTLDGDRARLDAVLDPSPDRAVPPCPHFGACGGCTLQHAAPALQARFKTEGLKRALAAAGVEGRIEPMASVAPGSRRRVVLGLARIEGRAVLGFHGRRSGVVLPITACAVAAPPIVAALPGLLALLGPVSPASGERDVTVTHTDAGLDVAVSGPPRTDTARLIEGARALGLARLTLGGEVVATFRTPTIDIDGIPVALAPGGFLQAVSAAEDLLAERVRAHLSRAKRVADLFSGVGAFALRLARASAVHALDADPAAVAALDRARRGVAGLKPVSVERRDLFRRPLSVAELEPFDGVVLDPPRQGAEAQIGELARSRVARIAYVSCEPTSFARDARVLIDAGYRLGPILPVDQFLWSTHLELVAGFERAGRASDRFRL